MADGDHYAAYSDVQYLLMNAGLGTSGNTMFDANGIETALDVTMGQIHFDIDVSAKQTNTAIAAALRTIQIDLVSMHILRARHFQQNNLADPGSIQAFWQYQPTYTREHWRIIRQIRKRLHGATHAYNTRTGEKVVW